MSAPSGEFVGLDPDECRDLASAAGGAGETAGHLAEEVAGTLAVAQIDDNGFHALCVEVDEELGLLRDLLNARAEQMELAELGIHFSTAFDAATAALWASLLDDTGEGVDFDDDPDGDDTVVTLSPTVAATAMAEYLAMLGAEVTWDDLNDIAQDEDVPLAYRAAAQYFLTNGDLWVEVPKHPLWPASGQDFEDFVVTNAALATMALNFDRWDTANDGNPETADGKVGPKDLEAVAANEDGLYSDEEQAAARWLLEVPHTYPLWESREVLTHNLYKRQVFTDDPELAVEYLRQAQLDPDAFFVDYTWIDTDGGRAWMDAALSSTSDPAEQAELLLAFAAVYQATMPEPMGLLDIAHMLLDGLSFIDPFQVADALNAGIYALEGDEVNAAIAAGGILIPLGGGGLIRMSKEALVGLASRRGGDAFSEQILRTALRNGTFTDDLIDQAVKQVDDQFDEATGSALRRYLYELRDGPILDDLGPGAWAAKHESMSPRAAQFQAEVTGAPPGTVYRTNGVDFDGFDNGVLLDAKGPGYARFVSDGEFKPWYTGADSLVDQARRQLDAANGMPVRWIVAEPEAAAAIRRLLDDAGLSQIDVVG